MLMFGSPCIASAVMLAAAVLDSETNLPVGVSPYEDIIIFGNAALSAIGPGIGVLFTRWLPGNKLILTPIFALAGLFTYAVLTLIGVQFTGGL